MIGSKEKGIGESRAESPNHQTDGAYIGTQKGKNSDCGDTTVIKRSKRTIILGKPYLRSNTHATQPKKKKRRPGSVGTAQKSNTRKIEYQEGKCKQP